MQQKASTCSVTYDKFFTIRKRPEESLPALSARVEQAMARIQQLHPTTFTLKTLDNELSCMAMMHALGDESKHFTSSLALLTDLDMDKVKVVFQMEEINRRPCSEASTLSVLSASTSTCHCNPSLPCAFCDKAGHCQCKCYTLQRTKDTYKSSKRSGRQPNQANTISTAPATHSTTSTTDITNVASQDVVECAGNASLHSIDPSDPLLPLQLNADVDWNADTGATSHMMPYRHWLCNYTPKHVPIKLADNAVVYSAGVGSVVFHPNLEGKRGRVVEFSNVLHVPHLHNNLLAVLYLTRHSSFVVHINATHMSFAGLGSPGQRGRLEDTRQRCQRSIGSVYSVLRMYIATHSLVLHMYRTTLGIGPLHLVMRVGSKFPLSFLQSTACSTVSSLIFVSRFFSVAIHTSTPRVTLYHIPCSCTPS